jgi:hypothetical protein
MTSQSGHFRPIQRGFAMFGKNVTSTSGLWDYFVASSVLSSKAISEITPSIAPLIALGSPFFLLGHIAFYDECRDLLGAHLNSNAARPLPYAFSMPPRSLGGGFWLSGRCAHTISI